MLWYILISYHCKLTEFDRLVATLHVCGHLKCLLSQNVYDRVVLYRVNWQRSWSRVFVSLLCFVTMSYSHVLGGLWVLLYSVLFVRHAKDQRARWRSVGWMNRPGWMAVCMSVRRCVTVGEDHDIKQYHSGLCALTQGTLCTFLQGWGDGGEAKGGGLQLYGGGLLSVLS